MMMKTRSQCHCYFSQPPPPWKLRLFAFRSCCYGVEGIDVLRAYGIWSIKGGHGRCLTEKKMSNLMWEDQFCSYFWAISTVLYPALLEYETYFCLGASVFHLSLCAPRPYCRSSFCYLGLFFFSGKSVEWTSWNTAPTSHPWPRSVCSSQRGKWGRVVATLSKNVCMALQKRPEPHSYLVWALDSRQAGVWDYPSLWDSLKNRCFPNDHSYS